MSDGHDKDRMSAPKPNGVTRQSPMILVVSLEYDIVMRQSSMVHRKSLVSTV